MNALVGCGYFPCNAVAFISNRCFCSQRHAPSSDNLWQDNVSLTQQERVTLPFPPLPPPLSPRDPHPALRHRLRDVRHPHNVRQTRGDADVTPEANVPVQAELQVLGLQAVWAAVSDGGGDCAGGEFPGRSKNRTGSRRRSRRPQLFCRRTSTAAHSAEVKVCHPDGSDVPSAVYMSPTLGCTGGLHGP